MDLLYLSEHQTRRKPQAGTPCTLSWTEFADWLSKPIWGEEKTEAGGYSPAKYNENVRHLDKMIHVCVLVFDIDVNGEVPRVAEQVKDYSCIIHETFSSSDIEKRCRLLIQLQDPIDAATYTRAHKKIRKELHERHVWADEHATDASRLSYCPVRLPGSGYGFAVLLGAAVDAKSKARDVGFHDDAVAKIKPERSANVTRQYVEAAVLSAQQNLRDAHDGSRHATLLRESLSLARPELGLTLEQIEDALFDVAVARMGSSRIHEIRAAITSGFAKMRG